MAGNTSYTASNSSLESKEHLTLPASYCIPWLVVGIFESLAVVILNLITMIVFVNQQQLQRQSRYLIIHLAIVDLFVGGVSGPLRHVHGMSFACSLGESPKALILFASLFPTASLINLAIISMERLHATIFPLRHRFIQKWVYGVVIAAIWGITILGEMLQIILILYLKLDSPTGAILPMIYYIFFLLVICVSYTSIFIKVRLSSNPHQHGATERERKLTFTLIWVTFTSLIFWLPFIVLTIITQFDEATSSSLRENYLFSSAAAVFVGANSFANPIVYAITMPQFRVGVAKIFRRAPNDVRPADLPLRYQSSRCHISKHSCDHDQRCQST